MIDMSVSIVRDTATPALEGIRRALTPQQVRFAVGTRCAMMVREHLRDLGPNKRGWPSTGFYAGAAEGTMWDGSDEGVIIYIDNEKAPGAMRQRYHGGTINSKDHLLTIPARAEFYGQRATDFTNLRFVMFFSGAKALVIGEGGTGKVNFETGKERSVKGAGARSALMVAYWLVDSVDQEGDPDVIPTNAELANSAVDAVLQAVREEGGAA